MTRRFQSRPLLSDRRGAASVEFALIGSVLFLVIFGCIEFSRIALLRNLAQDACYEAARECMVEGATTQEAVDKALAVLRPIGAKGTVVSINDGVGITTATSDVQVELLIPMENNSILFKPFFRNRTIQVGITLRRERYDGFYNGSTR